MHRVQTIRNCVSVAILAASLASAVPARAQIASYIDEHGKLIFVNGDSPKPLRGSTISNAHPVNLAAPLRFAAPATPPDRLDRIVREAAERHQVDPALVKAVISTESGWNPQAVSRKGAVGLMQLIPETAQRFGVGNPYDPAQNVEAGTTYLKTLLDRYDGDLNKSLAAYNAGPSRAADWNRVERRTRVAGLFSRTNDALRHRPKPHLDSSAFPGSRNRRVRTRQFRRAPRC